MPAYRLIYKQRPTKRPQVRTQRPDHRGNPDFGGEPWGSVNWPVDTADTAADLTPEIFGRRAAPFRTLAALQADATYGDGNLAYNSGANFGVNEFVYLGDGSQANYDTAAWSAGAHA